MRRASPPRSPAVDAMRTAAAPFNIQMADASAVLVSSDGVQFFVFKAILAMASPFFSDLFSLKQPPPKPSVSSPRDPIVVSEDSTTLDHLFRLCYPIRNPVMSDVHTVGKVLEAAFKYEMDYIAELVKDVYHGFVQKHPLGVYTVACRLKLEPEAKMAAEAWRSLAQPFSNDGEFSATVAGAGYTPGMAQISAGAYFRLLQYGRNERTADEPFCDPPSDAPSPLVDLTPHPATSNSTSSADSGDLYTEDADVTLQSSDGIKFPVHTQVLCVASAHSLLEGDPTKSEVTESGMCVVSVDIPGRILLLLLKLCHPLCRVQHSLGDVSTVCAAISVATSRNMTRVVGHLKGELTSLIPRHPLSIFFHVVDLGWTDMAQECCKHAARIDLDRAYVPEMEGGSASSYYKLLEYRHDCLGAAYGVVVNFAPDISRGSASVRSVLNKVSQHQNPISFVIAERELRKHARSRRPADVDLDRLILESADFEVALDFAMTMVPLPVEFATNGT